MTLAEILAETETWLREHRVVSPQLQAESILIHVLSCSRGDRLKQGAAELPILTQREITRVRELTESRVEPPVEDWFRAPRPFGGIHVACSPRAALPRADSEVLVDLVEKSLHHETPGRLIDVGTGVGGVALALARRLPDWRITGTDITLGALMLAHHNTRQFVPDVISRVTWEISDLLVHVDGEIDAVVANLPYVGSDDLQCAENEVSADPRAALDGGQDGLDLIRRLIPQAASRTSRLFMEVGPLHAERVAELMTDSGFSRVEVFKDLLGRERFVFGFDSIHNA